MDVASANSIHKFLQSDDPFVPTVREAVQVIEDILDEYGFDHIAISFNGGKDCTVLLHLFAAILVYRATNGLPIWKIPNGHSSESHYSRDATSASRFSSVSSYPDLYAPIRAIYIACDDPFPEVESFVEDSVKRYNLDLVRSDGGMKEALTSYLGSTSGMKLSDGSSPGHGVRAMLVGTRRGDPHGGSLGFVTPTDSDWPKLLRVHPIINWSYHDVWKFLSKFKVPYCSLYDAGYTSLGSIHNTTPNPALLNNPPHSQSATYKPAHELEDGDLERAGRGNQGPLASLPLYFSPSLHPSTAFPSLPQPPPHLPIATVSSLPTASATGAAAISTLST